MTIYSVLFYIISAVVIVSTGMAVTRYNLVHAVVYLVISFFGSAMLFYLMGAPLLAALEVIIYAGAIMILFLFIIMMLKTEGIEERIIPLSQWFPAAGLGFVSLVVFVLIFISGGQTSLPLKLSVAKPGIFGHYLFQQHWLSIEIASLLLLVALIGVLHMGMSRDDKHKNN
ncbi:NADH-ubiquinone/plastoquinone oxidoreductase domain-containing protein [Desulfonema limicola]|uniref:NADH-quinone oxidoreductase subunit J n=1 Tax=Desulfonema limicola TaxID=45656 RepID=A0A975B7Q8_9BACT|nr:NADH-quinone oxidoreductase subunit J [Desulfonema limicola]QTA80213.1 NADH-ubiquinone/plastoquinone oxidoreductase domain-containing protein [Desulfonema limicola]